MPLIRRLLVALIVAPLVLAQLGVLPTRADEIQDARTRHRDLLASIERQQTLLDELLQEESEIRTALEATAGDLKTLNADQHALREQIQAANDALARVEGRFERLVHEIEQLDWTLAMLDEQVRQGEQDLAARRELLGERLAQAYRTQQTTLLEQLLAAESLADVFTSTDAALRFGDQDMVLAQQIEIDQAALETLRRLALTTRFQSDQLRRIAQTRAAEIRGQRSELRSARERLEELEAETLRLQQEQQARFDEVAGNRREADRLLSKQEREASQLRNEISRLVEEAQERAREAERREQERRERERQNQPTPAPQRPNPTPRPSGVLIWPTRGYITQEYGCTGFSWEPPRGSCSHFHGGIDIANSSGTPIYAARSGVVMHAGYNPYESGSNRSWIVAIAHPGSMSTWYTHLQPRYAPGIRPGVSVAQGDLIGYMGMTGRATGPHLHFEVLVNGRDANPRRWL